MPAPSELKIASTSLDADTSDDTHARQKATWQKELSASNLSIGELLSRLELPLPEQTTLLEAHRAQRDFPLQVTASFIRRMRKKDPNDPLLLQILPSALENEVHPGYSNDPLAEQHFNPLPGLLHKYQSRALLTVANSCAINCRYGFRRHFPYSENNPAKKQWQPVFEYLRQHREINEVIYSGGDPLVAKDQYLSWLNQSLMAIPSITRLRLHSRLPVVLPSRIDCGFLNAMSDWKKQTVMVIHCNHPNEINAEVAECIAKMRNAGMTVFNQSVLLKGINDSSEVLATLSEELFNIGVMPYYVHQLDQVQGAAHFAVSNSRAREIQQTLSAKTRRISCPEVRSRMPQRSE